MRILFNNKENWWKLWAIITPINVALFMAISVSINSYLFIGSEFLIPALFGLYIINKEKFKTNLMKLTLIFVLLFFIVFTFGSLSKVIAPILLFLFMWIIRFSKDEILWSFGTVVVFTLSGIIGLIFLLVFNHNILLLAVGYIIKGAIFGKLMQIFYEKRLKRLSSDCND